MSFSSLRIRTWLMLWMPVLFLGFTLAGCGADSPDYEIIIEPETISSSGDIREAYSIVETGASGQGELEALCGALAEDFSERHSEYDAIRASLEGSGGTIAIFRDDSAKEEFDEFHELYEGDVPYVEYCYF